MLEIHYEGILKYKNKNLGILFAKVTLKKYQLFVFFSPILLLFSVQRPFIYQESTLQSMQDLHIFFLKCQYLVQSLLCQPA